MDMFSAESFITALAVIGVVIIVSALLSGLIERSGLPQVAVFLALRRGARPRRPRRAQHLARFVRAARRRDPESRARAVYRRRLAQHRRGEAPRLAGVPLARARHAAHRRAHRACRLVAARAAAWRQAAILGAALASSDPVLLRGLLRRRDIPATRATRCNWRAGLTMSCCCRSCSSRWLFSIQGSRSAGAGFAKLGLNLFILGPGAGILIGLARCGGPGPDQEAPRRAARL